MGFVMTDRLYYHDSFVYDFDADVRAVVADPRPALILDRTAFYPTSGGQPFDAGWIAVGDIVHPTREMRVVEVAESTDGAIVHYVEIPEGGGKLAGAIEAPWHARVHGRVGSGLRRPRSHATAFGAACAVGRL